MAQDLLRTLLECMEVFRPALTRPGFANLLVVLTGWVLTPGTHAVTEALLATSVAGRRHHEAFHRFFSRGTWNPDAFGRLLFTWIVRLIPAERAIELALDDTLASKKGPQVFGMGSHLDAVRSSRRYRVFCFGHCWVVLALRIKVPFSRRPWALPILFRLYRTNQECKNKRARYRKKTELAREMLDVLLGWVADRRVEVAADSAYCNSTVTRDLPDSVVLLGAMRPDAALTDETPTHQYSPKGGRPRKRGKRLSTPETIANDKRRPWKSCKANIYGSERKVRYKEMFAQWYRVCGVRLLRIIITKSQDELRIFFSTDASLSVRDILEGYAGRWSIEVCFRNLKQMMGFADSTARKQAAVERTAPFVGFAYTFLVAWFIEHAHSRSFVVLPTRPWYSHKEGLSFADVLRTAQRVLAPLDVLDPRRSIEDLHQTSAASRSSPKTKPPAAKRAA